MQNSLPFSNKVQLEFFFVVAIISCNIGLKLSSGYLPDKHVQPFKCGTMVHTSFTSYYDLMRQVTGITVTNNGMNWLKQHAREDDRWTDLPETFVKYLTLFGQFINWLYSPSCSSNTGGLHRSGDLGGHFRCSHSWRGPPRRVQPVPHQHQ